MVSNAEKASIWWRHHGLTHCVLYHRHNISLKWVGANQVGKMHKSGVYVVIYCRRQNVIPLWKIHDAVLTSCGRDKMAVSLQTACSKSFSWMTIVAFWFKFHWHVFPMFQCIKTDRILWYSPADTQPRKIWQQWEKVDTFDLMVIIKLFKIYPVDHISWRHTTQFITKMIKKVTKRTNSLDVSAPGHSPWILDWACFHWTPLCHVYIPY